ncbi:MAG: hypothetical protein AAFZ15_07580 [Bacteroidota bacterium]
MIVKTQKYLTFLLFFLLLIGCNSRNSDQIDLKQRLIYQLIDSPEIQSAKVDGKIAILKGKYCGAFDCEKYFEGYQEQIQMYSIEDLFMRGFPDYLEIENIEGDKITVRKRGGSNYQKIEIKI